jgi:hypothetical protein
MSERKERSSPPLMQELLMLRKSASGLTAKLLAAPAESILVAQRSAEVIFDLNTRIGKIIECMVEDRYNTTERGIYLDRTECLEEARKTHVVRTNWGKKYTLEQARVHLDKVIQLDLELSQYDDLIAALPVLA